MRRFLSSLFSEDAAHVAFVRNHGPLIAAIFGVPADHVPMSDETPLFEPNLVPHHVRRRGKRKPRGGRVA
jgi:hypothetical protein